MSTREGEQPRRTATVRATSEMRVMEVQPHQIKWVTSLDAVRHPLAGRA